MSQRHITKTLLIGASPISCDPCEKFGLKQCKIRTVGGDTSLNIGHQKKLLVLHLRAKIPVTQAESVLTYGTAGRLRL